MTKLNPVENDVKERVKKLLDKYGWFHFSVPAAVYGGNGISDRLAIKGGLLFAIEVKLKTAKGGSIDVPKGTPLQERFLANVRLAGGYGMVVNDRNMDEFENALKHIDDRLRGVP